MSFVDDLRAIGRKPGLYPGQPSLGYLFAFIVGFQTGKLRPDDTGVLDSFEFGFITIVGRDLERHNGSEDGC
jgi:hypothetical protein